MNLKRVVMAGVAAWVVSLPVGFVINEYLLADIYAANAASMRPDADMTSNLPVGFAFLLVGFLVFAYMYAKGYEGGSGIGEGARFGFLAGVLVVCLGLVWQWVLYPIDLTMAVAMCIDGIAEATLYGVIVGAIYKRA